MTPLDIVLICLASAGAVSSLALLWTLRCRKEHLLSEKENLKSTLVQCQALFRYSTDVILVINSHAAIKYGSPAVQRLWGYEDDAELIDKSVYDYIHADDIYILRSEIVNARATPDGAFIVDARVRHADGSWRVSEISIKNLLREPGVEGLVLTCRDVMERKAFEAELERRAFYDTLTGLPNRALFVETLKRTLARRDVKKKPIAVIFLDLNNFKVINDSLGHKSGDELLLAVAQRLTGCVRPSDMVARLGGDSFTILIECLLDARDAITIAERVTRGLKDPVLVGGREIFPSANIGIVISSGEHQTPEDVLRDADTAMCQAKVSGKSSYVTFNSSMNEIARERSEIECDLRRAIEGDELRVYYQPILNLESHAIREVEALVRWQHPKRGLLEPAAFMPVAEQTGLIVRLGQWVLETACRQAHEWQISHASDPPLRVNVNLSARQLRDPGIVRQVARALRDSGLPPQQLRIDITENVMIDSPNVTLPILQDIKLLGVSLAVDDFGTGYSSISYLSNLPIDTLKIDRTIIGKIGKSRDDDAVLRAIVTMAKMMDLATISEGIETEAQYDALRELGCDQGQGYLFARPAPSDDLDKLLCAQDEKRLGSPEVPVAQDDKAA